MVKKSTTPTPVTKRTVDLHKYYTGFKHEEIIQITKALKFCRVNAQNFDYPTYGGLPKAISKRLSSDQVDYLQEFSTVSSYYKPDCFSKQITVCTVGKELARGKE